MSYESQLLEHFPELCWKVESLAMGSVHDIQIPVCGVLFELTSADCINLIKRVIDGLSHLNQPSIEKILLIYLVSDYISCGLSSPVYYSVFNKSLQSNKSKIKFLKNVIASWECLFKNYDITSLNFEFISHFILSLEHLFNKMLNSVPDSHIKILSIKMLNIIKFHIRSYEQDLLNNQVFQSFHHISCNDMELKQSNKNRLSDIGNIVLTNEQKVKLLIQRLVQQGKQKREDEENRVGNKKSEIKNDQQKGNVDMFATNHKYNTEPFEDNHLSIKSKYIPTDAQHLLNESTKSDTGVIVDQQLSQQKLNAFQVMMLSAKKHKMKKSK